MRKKLLIVGDAAVWVVLALLTAVAAYCRYAIGQPSYKLEMVRVGKNLRPSLAPPAYQSG